MHRGEVDCDNHLMKFHECAIDIATNGPRPFVGPAVAPPRPQMPLVYRPTNPIVRPPAPGVVE